MNYQVMINTKNIEDISTNQIGFSSENISNLINIGGPVVIILLVLSLVATAIAISKGLHLIFIGLSYKKNVLKQSSDGHLSAEEIHKALREMVMISA